MDLSVPLIPKEQSLSGDWFRLEHGANAASVKCASGRTETLIYVVFGDDFIAGLRVDRKTWILVPARSVISVTFNALGAHWLPPVRQTSDEARAYLQGLGPVELRVWPVGQDEPLPAAPANIQGSWLVLSRSHDGTAERLVAVESVALIEVVDVAAAVRDLDGARVGN
ncbi:MAG: hypothetical protein KGL72_06040 [Actinomycetales bacterium]|nr:hypothetical protein [Actinomycetales bacterium]